MFHNLKPNQMQATTFPSKIELTQKEYENSFAISCFLHIMKSNMALNNHTRIIIMDFAADRVVKGKMSKEFFNSLFPNDAN
jgi:hypothetical protein